MKKYFKHIRSMLRFLESTAGDLILNISTSGYFGIDKDMSINKDSHPFETLSHTAIIRSISMVRPQENDVVFVLGSGKGRMLCHFARVNVKKVVGVEITPILCGIARENVKKLRGKKSQVEVICCDAAEADLSDANILAMFNPFGEKTLRDVLRNLKTEIHNKSIKLSFIYINPKHLNIFIEDGNYKIICDVRRMTGQRIVVLSYEAD